MKRAKGFGKQIKPFKAHPIYHKGIDRFVSRILGSIAATQFKFENPIYIQITNDHPFDPNERSLGLTADQIDQLKLWLAETQAQRSEKVKIFVLRVEDCPSHGLLWKLKDWTKIMTAI